MNLLFREINSKLTRLLIGGFGLEVLENVLNLDAFCETASNRVTFALYKKQTYKYLDNTRRILFLLLCVEYDLHFLILILCFIFVLIF